jgi:hypothetical protein
MKAANIKTSIWVKFLIVLPLVLLVDYLIMVILGCASCLFGFDNNFNCSIYCIVGKIILALSAILFGLYIFPDIKNILKSNRNGATTEK